MKTKPFTQVGVRSARPNLHEIEVMLLNNCRRPSQLAGTID